MKSRKIFESFAALQTFAAINLDTAQMDVYFALASSVASHLSNSSLLINSIALGQE